MRHSLALIAMSLLVGLTACGSLSQYSDASRFQDGIYYKATDEVAFVPKSEEDFKQDAILKGLGNASDTLTIIADQVNVYTFDPFVSSWWTFAPLSYRWWYHDAFYWGYYPYGMYSSWYDPFYYDSWYWGYPYYNPYHHHHYDWAYRPPMHGHPSNNTVYTRRSGSATSGIYSRPSSSSSGNRSAVSSGSVRRATVSRGAKTTSRSFSESFNDNSATRRSSSASYDSSRGSDTYRRSSGSTYRSGSSSMGSSRSGGGFSGGGSSHSSGGSSMSRGGRR